MADWGFDRCSDRLEEGSSYVQSLLAVVQLGTAVSRGRDSADAATSDDCYSARLDSETIPGRRCARAGQDIPTNGIC